MKSLSDYRPTQSFGLLLIGPPKSGKTAFALQFPKPYILDCDNNLQGAVRFMKEKKFAGLSEVRYDTIKVSDTGTEVEDKECWTRLTNLAKKAIVDPTIETIVVDTLSFTADFLVWHILTHGGGQKIDGTSEKMLRIQDYQAFANMMKKFIMMLRSSNKLVIVTAHESLEKDEATGRWVGGVAVPGQLKNNLGGMFSDVWMAEVGVKNSGAEHEFNIRSMPTTRHSLGNSLGLPPVFPMNFQKEIAPRLLLNPQPQASA